MAHPTQGPSMSGGMPTSINRHFSSTDDFQGGLGQLGTAVKLGRYGSGLTGNDQLSAGLGSVGQGLGYLGALNSMGNILQGHGGVGDYAKTGKTAYDLYNNYQAAQAAGSGAAGGGEAAAGAGMGAGMAFTGGLGAIAAYGAARDATEAKNRIEGANRTAGRLRDIGVSQRELDPNKLFYSSTPWMETGGKFGDLSKWSDDSNLDPRQVYQPGLQLNQAYYDRLAALHPRIASEIGAGDIAGDYGQIAGADVLARGYQNEQAWLEKNMPGYMQAMRDNQLQSGG